MEGFGGEDSEGEGGGWGIAGGVLIETLRHGLCDK